MENIINNSNQLHMSGSASNEKGGPSNEKGRASNDHRALHMELIVILKHSRIYSYNTYTNNSEYFGGLI